MQYNTDKCRSEEKRGGPLSIRPYVRILWVRPRNSVFRGIQMVTVIFLSLRFSALWEYFGTVVVFSALLFQRTDPDQFNCIPRWISAETFFLF